MKINRKIWIFIVIFAFSLIGVAYGAWHQTINVSSTIKTASFDGAFYYKKNDETVVVNESEFSNNYSIEVSRNLDNAKRGIAKKDVIVIKNKSSIPAKYYLENQRGLTSTLVVTYQIEEVAEEKSDKKAKNHIKTHTEEIVIPSDQWSFSIEVSGATHSDLSYASFLDKINEYTSKGVDSKSQVKIKISETLKGDVEDYVALPDEEGTSVLGYSCELFWSYDFNVKQLPFNQ